MKSDRERKKEKVLAWELEREIGPGLIEIYRLVRLIGPG